MVVGYTYATQANQANPSAEITKEVRQCFESSTPATPPSLDDKIQIRNDTIYKPVRSDDAWKKKYERHGQQASRGFFSSVARPYETFGELELNLRQLVIKTLGEKTFQQQTAAPQKESLWSKIRNNREILFTLNDSEDGSKSAKAKEQSNMNKHMTSVIGKRLNLMKNRLVAVRAGQSYENCLRQENQRKMLEMLEEQKHDTHLTLNIHHGPQFIRKKSVLSSRKSIANEDVASLEDATKLDASELQEYHKRKCKSFVATLEALYSLICCVYHLKARDLRTKVPLSRDYIKVINTDVPIDSKGKPVRHQRITITARNQSDSTDSCNIRGSDSDRVTSTVTFPPNDSLPNVFRPPTMEGGSHLEKQNVGFAAKRFKPVVTRPNTLEDISEPGGQSHQENTTSRSGVSRSSFLTAFNFNALKAKRGNFLVLLANSGNNAEFGHGQALPVWQQVATNEKSDKKVKPGSVSAPRKPAKHSKRGFNIEQFRDEFNEAQQRCSKRLSEEIKRIEKLEKPSFREKLKALRASHLIEHDMVIMRRATSKMLQDYRDENVRPSGWFEVLCEQAQDLDVDDDDEVDTLLEKFAPFSKDDIETLAHVKSKLCLIVQSLPLYELCQLSMQEAVKFFLEKILSCPSHTLLDWMAHRKIKPTMES